MPIPQTYGAIPHPHRPHRRSLTPPHHQRRHPPLAKSQHLGGSRQYWRDIILGVNDGLISTFLLVAGVAGGGLSAADILLTAVAGALAGAVSMATGEYVATKSQNEVMQGELQLEEQHVELYKEDELLELENLLPLIGIGLSHEGDGVTTTATSNGNTTLAHHLLQHYRQDSDALLKVMTVLEFGIVDEEVRSPYRAGLVSCLLFLAGSLPSVLPFCFLAEPHNNDNDTQHDDGATWGLLWAAMGTTLALFGVGAVKTWATRGTWWTAAVENLAIAGCGGLLAYLVGVLFDHLVHG